MQCDMCGKEGQLFKTVIEEVEMKVCKACSSYGKVISEIRIPGKKSAKHAESKPVEKITVKEPEKVIVQMIVKDYSNIIKKKREKMNMTQKEFAMFLNEKEGIVHKIETNSFEPSIEMARRLGKILGVKLIEEYEEEKLATERSSGNQITVGDLIKIKTRKKH